MRQDLLYLPGSGVGASGALVGLQVQAFLRVQLVGAPDLVHQDPRVRVDGLIPVEIQADEHRNFGVARRQVEQDLHERAVVSVTEVDGDLLANRLALQRLGVHQRRHDPDVCVPGRRLAIDLVFEQGH